MMNILLILQDTSASGGAFEGWFGPLSTLMISVGSIVGLISAIKIYNNWHMGKPDAFEGVSNLILGCLMLIISGIGIKIIFYGI